jgi:methyl-accepting chemotaxis protein
MTKTIISDLLIIGALAAVWISLKTGEQTNQDASGRVIQALDNKVEAYRKENSDNFAAVIDHVDAGQKKTQDLTEGVKGIADTLIGIAKSATDLGQQNKQLLEGQNQVLEEHSKSLEEVKTGAKKATANAAEAVSVARKDQARTQRAIREIQKPKKSWWSGLFASPTPTPRRR